MRILLNKRLLAFLLLMFSPPSRAFLILTPSRRGIGGSGGLASNFASSNSMSRHKSSSTTTRLFSSTSNKAAAVTTTTIPTCTDCWRPTVQDVERISWGKPAKKKGTGSRGVPHRLNQDERMQWDLARQYGFLQVKGSAWRSERRDAPLLNSWRSLCDAKSQACIVVHKQAAAEGDLVVVDLSPLRLPSEFAHVTELCLQQQEGGSVIYQGAADAEQSTTGTVSEDDDDDEEELNHNWMSRPIYQLPPYRVVWESLDRSNAKALAKTLSKILHTADPNKKTKRSPSKKPFGVKHGKNRRHGGYGIG